MFGQHFFQSRQVKGLGKASPAPIYFSESLARSPTAVLSTVPFADQVAATFPYQTPDRYAPRAFRVRSWLRSKRIESNHERILLNTYFAASVAEHALVHMVDNFFREYLIETIEHGGSNRSRFVNHVSATPGRCGER